MSLVKSESVLAAEVAGRLIQSANGFKANIARILTSGVPAQQGQPAVSAAAIREALGTFNVAKLELVVANLGD